MSRINRSRNETQLQLIIAGAFISIALIAAACYFIFNGAIPFGG